MRANVIETSYTRQDAIITNETRSNNPKTVLNRFVRSLYTMDPKQICDIDYTAGGTSNHKMESLADMFCDNMVLYYTVPDTEDNKHLREVQKTLLPEHTYTIKRIYNSHGLDISKAAIKPICSTCDDCSKQNIKVDMSRTSFATLLKHFDSLCTDLASANIYLHDIDITRDYVGVFCKDALRQNLETIPNITVVDNDQYVGRNCLTFMYTDSTGIKGRYKYYNKFVQSIESPGVRNDTGSHIRDWIDNPENELAVAIPKCMESGIVRLEYTLYNYGEAVCFAPLHYLDSNTSLTDGLLEENMSFLESLLPPNLLYHNPITAQWGMLLDCLSHTVIAIDDDSKTALVSWWCNTLTGKVQGFYVDEVDANSLTNVVKLYTPNLPLMVFICKQLVVDKDRFLCVQQDVYSKTDSVTYIPKGSSNLKTYIPETPIDPTLFGLTDSPKLRLRTQPNKVSIRTKASNKIDVGVTHMDFPLHPYLNRTESTTTPVVDHRQALLDGIANLKRIEELRDELERKQCSIKDEARNAKAKNTRIEAIESLYKTLRTCVNYYRGDKAQPSFTKGDTLYVFYTGLYKKTIPIAVVSKTTDCTDPFVIPFAQPVDETLEYAGYGPLLRITKLGEIVQRKKRTDIWDVQVLDTTEYANEKTTIENYITQYIKDNTNDTTPIEHTIEALLTKPSNDLIPIGSIIDAKVTWDTTRQGDMRVTLANGTEIQQTSPSLNEHEPYYLVVDYTAAYGYLLIDYNNTRYIGKAVSDHYDTFTKLLPSIDIHYRWEHTMEDVKELDEYSLIETKAKESIDAITEEETLTKLLNGPYQTSTKGLEITAGTTLSIIGVKPKVLLCKSNTDFILLRTTKELSEYMTSKGYNGVNPKGFVSIVKHKNGSDKNRNAEAKWLIQDGKEVYTTNSKTTNIDKVVKEGDVIELQQYSKYRRGYKGVIVVNGANRFDVTISYWLNALLATVAERTFTVGPYKNTPSNNSCRTFTVKA